MDVLHEKLLSLERSLADMVSAAVAFSAGVDSTFLMKLAHQVLGDRAVAVTVRSDFFPDRELCEAKTFCEQNKIEQIFIDMDALSVEGVRQNPADRCYLCKRALFLRIREAAALRDLREIAEGSNLDDRSDYRPGMRAVAELGVRSPLLEAGLTKSEIRLLSKELGLPTWNKQSFACLATRFVYGEAISEEKLRMVDQAEQLLLDLGFHQVRVRVHGLVARIEVRRDELARLVEEEIGKQISSALHQLGFHYVTADLSGYRSGSMNDSVSDRNS